MYICSGTMNAMLLLLWPKLSHPEPLNQWHVRLGYARLNFFQIFVKHSTTKNDDWQKRGFSPFFKCPTSSKILNVLAKYWSFWRRHFSFLTGQFHRSWKSTLHPHQDIVEKPGSDPTRRPHHQSGAPQQRTRQIKTHRSHIAVYCIISNQ